jgi:hypothetical protein
MMVNGGNITITVVNAQDLAGNSINSNGTHTGGGIATVPSAPTSISLVTPSSSPGNVTTPTFQVGGVTSGYSISIYDSAACNANLKGTATASGTTVDVTSSALTNGNTYTLYATQTDTIGNTSACSSANVAYTVDTTAPTVAITTPANASYANLSNYTSFTISGTCSENSRTVTVAATDGTTTVNPASQPTCSGGTFSTAVNLATLGASISLTAAQTDAAGNSTTSSTISITKDIVAPVLSITTPASSGTYVYASTASSVTLSGSCTENGSTVSVAATNSSTVNASPTCNTSSSPNWTTTVNLSSLPDGVISITASQTDLAGNTGTSSAVTIIKDATPPVITLTQNYNYLYPLTDPHAPVTQGSTVTYTASASDASVNSVTANSSFSCTYQTVGFSSSDPNYASGANCNTLPSLGTSNSVTILTTASWSPGSASATANASFSWTPTSKQRGTYKFTLTATDGQNSSTQDFYITVRENYTTTNLMAQLDALFSGVGASAPLTSVASSPRLTATGNNNKTELWHTLTGSSDGDLNAFSTSAPWGGSGQSSTSSVDPYKLSFAGADSLTLGSIVNTTPATSRYSISTWIKPSSPSSAGTVIADNGGVSGDGFTLRQSKNPTGRAEWVIGKKFYSYTSLVLADGALSYWRLDESSGSLLDTSTENNWGTYQGTVTLSQTGALGGSGDSNTAVKFNGSNAFVSTSHSYTNPTNFSLEAWIKTSTSSGGRIIGFGDSQTGTSTYRDRNIYMSDSGQIYFGVAPGGIVTTINTAASYNNDAWHHIVATQSSTSGMTLYVDGVSRATSSSGTSAQNYTGYWKIGFDSLSSWSGTHTSNYFNGTIDEVAVYNYALTSTQVADHYNTAITANYLPQPGNAILADKPARYYRLGENSGSIAYDLSGNGQNGTYTGGYTLGTTGAFTADADTAVTLDGSSGYISASDSGLPSGTSGASISAWVKPTALPASGVWMILADYGTASNNQSYHIALYNNSGTQQVCAGLYGGDVCFSTTLPTNSWTHITGSFLGWWTNLYINGSPKAGNFTTSNITLSTINIGKQPNAGGPSYFNGSIDEVAIFPYALNSAQVLNQYNNTAWWMCQSKTQLNASNWNLLETFYDGTTAKLFVNGVQECSVQPGTTYSASVANLIAGASSSLANFWSGAMATFNVFGTTDGSNPVSSTTALNDFNVSANRFRAIPLENIVTSGLIYHLDAANANQGTVAYANGCPSSSLSWFDLSSSASNGTLFNFSSCGSTSGWVGTGSTSNPYALAFDGTNDYVQVPWNQLTGNSARTISVWFMTSTNANRRFVSWGNNTTSQNSSLGYYNDGTNAWIGFFGVGNDNAISTTTTYSNSNWHHLAYSFSGTTSTLYLDASQKNTATQTLSTGSSNLYIGSNSGGAGAYAQGSIAIVQIYSRDLSANEVKQNCLAQEGRFTSSPQSICGTP